MSNVSPLNETLSDFLNYQSQPGHFDEMHDAAGNQREHWSHVIKALEALGPEELQRRQQEIQNLLRENGVTYRPEGSPRDNEHPWQLDLLPYLITSEEWLGVERALLQRAELFRLILEDIYGPGNAIKKGLIPAELLYTNPGFLRACVGVPVPSERYQMPFYAADITRRPDGSWCVISDRTQAPAGNGYALENRMLISRVLPSLFREAHVHRLATFFRAMRHTLQDMSWRQGDDVRIVMLNPGANNESYFEHAYLANYLGYTLVEGGDLTVRDGKVRLKTLDRLQPVDVIMRRVEDHLCDPLSLDQNSLIGVAGLLQAARRQQVAIANPLGSGVIGNASLMTVLPELAKHFLGEELLMPSSESWWCGHPDSLKHVLSNLSTLVIKRLGPKNAAPAWQGQTMSTAQLNELRQAIQSQPTQFIAQETVPCATLPVLGSKGLTSRRFVMRSFLVATREDYVVMPGGLTRMLPEFGEASTQILSKDTWVLASEQEQQTSLLPQVGASPYDLASLSELPSRVAENLFWLGRYAERSEGIIRLLRVVFTQLMDPAESSVGKDTERLNSLLRAVTHLTQTYPGFVGDNDEDDQEKLTKPETELFSVFLDPERGGSLSFNLQSLLYAAHNVRDRLSTDIWRMFNDIETGLERLQARRAHFSAEDPWMLSAALEQLNDLVTSFAAFSGFSMDGLTHGQGWRFLMMGRRLERAQQGVYLLRATLSNPISDEPTMLEHLLTVFDCLMTYRRRYRTQPQIEAVLYLLFQDENNPRSLAYQLRHLNDDVQKLPRENSNYRSAEERFVLDSLTRIRLAEVPDLSRSTGQPAFRKNLDQLLARQTRLLNSISETLSNAYFSHTKQPHQLVALLKPKNID